MTVRIDRENPTPFYQQISSQIIELIETGVYPAGFQLPSIRKMAHDLDVSTNTVEYAYRIIRQLGYIQSFRGSGFVVNPLKRDTRPTFSKSKDYLHDLEVLNAYTSSIQSEECVDYDFTYTQCDPILFPLAQWARLSRDVLYSSQANKLYCYNNRQGLLHLREQISYHLAQENGFKANPEQILIMPTTRMLVSSLLCLFDANNDCIAVENPGYYEVRNECLQHGFEVIDLPVDKSINQMLNILNASKPKLIYVTPSNQYPTNKVMPLAAREKFLAWAEENKAYILEDDYCFEFRYNSNQLPTLQELDTQGRVISLGTFSKSLSPAIGIGFAVLPPYLMQKWLNPTNIAHSLVPWQSQEMLACFMEQGLWVKHLRTIQTAYSKKHDALLKAIEKHLGGRVNVLDHETGIHILMRPTDNRTEAELINEALQNGIRVYPTSQCFSKTVPPSWNYVLLGFSSMPLDKIDEGIAALAKAWFH